MYSLITDVLHLQNTHLTQGPPGWHDGLRPSPVKRNDRPAKGRWETRRRWKHLQLPLGRKKIWDSTSIDPPT